ncbi:APC family permease [Frondihabitans australicus]|uniref:Amino acid transporter n=1 Tax=Frondihabitans australicus TaxID=386892 RepID=A0A495IKT6_9MICO|nr:APC family permease [Frondihabitans australicus]RKR76612.1 amino acid transporter [Frondihabitans australicus]
MALDISTPNLAPAAAESSKLKKHFGRFDILFFLICTIVGVDTIASVAASGGEAFTWMVVLAVVFFVPQALLFAELGSTFPQEGGPYIWTRMAFGHLAGAINNFLYWVTNPVWLGGTLASAAAYALQVFFHAGKDWPTVMIGGYAFPWAFYVITIPFIWVAVLAAVLSFRVGKWITTVGAFARFLLLGVFVVTVIVYGVEHGVHGLGAGSFTPSYAGFVALVGVLLFNYVGFELPNSAGEEMTNAKRDVPFAILRSAAFSFVLYAVPILGILLVIPVDKVTNLGGFVDAIQTTFSVFGGASGTVGAAAAVLFVACVLTSGVTWIMGSDRSLAVSGYDGAAPRFFGVIDAKLGTPVRVNIFSGIVSTVVLVLATTITEGNAYKFFGAVLGVTISTTLISYLLIFPSLWKLRRSHPDVERPFRMPWMRGLTVVLMLLLAFTVVQLMAPGAFYDWFGADFRPDGWKASEAGLYLLTELVPVVAFIVIGVIFWALGTKTRRENRALAQELDDAAAGVGVAASAEPGGPTPA